MFIGNRKALIEADRIPRNLITFVNPSQGNRRRALNRWRRRHQDWARRNKVMDYSVVTDADTGVNVLVTRLRRDGWQDIERTEIVYGNACATRLPALIL